MDRVEFLAILRESLEGYIPVADVEENIAFYRNYFEEAQISEKKVIEELGDPRLIARTIIQAYKASKGPMADYYEEQARSEYSQSHSSAGSSQGDRDFGEKKEWIKRRIIFGGFFLVVILVLVILLAVAGAIIMYLLPVLLVIFIAKLLFDYFNR